MRKRITALLLALLCLAAASFAAAEETADAAYRVVIDDEAGLLLTDAERREVLTEMEPILEYCNVGFYTTRESARIDVLGRAAMWGRETFGNYSDCTVFIIDMYSRELAVWSSDRIVDELVTVPKARQIVGSVYKLATDGKYAECAKETFRRIHTVMSGGKVIDTMHYVGNALMAVAAAILLAYLLISTRMEQEVKVSVPAVVLATAGAAGAAIVARRVDRVVHHSSSSGGHGGGFGGGGGGGGGGGASHGF